MAGAIPAVLGCGPSRQSGICAHGSGLGPGSGAGETFLLAYEAPRGWPGSTPLSCAMGRNTVDPCIGAAGRFEPGLLFTKPSTPTPRTRVGGAAPAEGRWREPAAGWIPSVPPAPCGWLGRARGESLGPPPVLPADFWATGGGGQKSVRSGPLGGAHQSAWSLYISILGRRTHHAGRSTQHAARSTASALANGKRRHQHLPKWLFRGVHPGKIKAGPSTPGAV
jgi:hypothetical protein